MTSGGRGRPFIPRAVAGILFASILLVSAGARQSRQEQHARQTMNVVAGAATFPVASFEQESVLFASVTALARGLALSVREDAARDKMEIVAGDMRLKFTADNPFVVVIRHAANTIEEVYHLPTEVRKRSGEYFVPVKMILPLLTRTLKRSLTFRENVPELIVALAGTTNPVAKVESGDESVGADKQSVADTREASDKRETGDKREASDASGADDTPESARTPKTGVKANPASSTLPPTRAVTEAASKADITRLAVDTRKNGTLVRIHCARRVRSYESALGGDGLLSIVIPGATVDANELRQTPIGGDDVLGVEAMQNGPDARIELRLNENVHAENVARDAQSNDLLLTLYRPAEVEKIYAEEQQDKRKKKEQSRSKWELDCIVIDAGHGGKDPGAVGPTGIKEKNITLGIALKLGELIERSMPNVKVVYTRDDDTFIELYRRGQIANEAGGKLFVSIHCNSTEEKPSTARGFDVYLLRPGRTEEAVRIAEFENSVIALEKDYQTRYRELTNENFILVNLAQSAYVKYAERFAELLHDEMKKSDKIRGRGVKQAGFLVLVGASMPSVLIETGFISNLKEESILASRAGQQHLARKIYSAIERFSREYEKSLKE